MQSAALFRLNRNGETIRKDDKDNKPVLELKLFTVDLELKKTLCETNFNDFQYA